MWEQDKTGFRLLDLPGLGKHVLYPEEPLMNNYFGLRLFFSLC